MGLHGKVALVTGSTGGIGLGIACALAAEGADLMLNGFGDPVEIEALRAGLAARSGVRVLYEAADIGRAEEAASLVARAQDALGGLDILVNNAGVQFTSPIREFPLAEWDRIIAINLSGAFYATRAAIPSMQARGWGRILNIASAHGLVASPYKAAYVAAKHGIVGLTKVAALELADSGVTVNAICPGWVLTKLVQAQIDERAARERRDADEVAHELVAEKQAMTRFTTPDQIGALAVFLCSDAAATMTGGALPIDGGWTAR